MAFCLQDFVEPAPCLALVLFCEKPQHKTGAATTRLMGNVFVINAHVHDNALDSSGSEWRTAQTQCTTKHGSNIEFCLAMQLYYLSLLKKTLLEVVYSQCNMLLRNFRVLSNVFYREAYILWTQPTHCTHQLVWNTQHHHHWKPWHRTNIDFHNQTHTRTHINTLKLEPQSCIAAFRERLIRVLTMNGKHQRLPTLIEMAFHRNSGMVFVFSWKALLVVQATRHYTRKFPQKTTASDALMLNSEISPSRRRKESRGISKLLDWTAQAHHWPFFLQLIICLYDCNIDKYFRLVYLSDQHCGMVDLSKCHKALILVE